MHTHTNILICYFSPLKFIYLKHELGREHLLWHVRICVYHSEERVNPFLTVK